MKDPGYAFQSKDPFKGKDLDDVMKEVKNPIKEKRIGVKSKELFS